ncbi:unnamed protein product [Mytilus coruscus]|uniref:TRPM SLOG domain-containing protein n=1 Tax=Mytilus coruscus TaxID=42192 RepID=A0A6J8CTH2_MYTCO|nr:unnamed protein product [Mytilus coruscus]
MKYSKYFPNHQEYASKVYRDIPNKLLCIENQEHVDIPPKDNPEETHPEAITSASQTEGPVITQTYTQTDDKIRHEMATQTDDEKITDSQKPSTNPSSVQWECLKKFGEPRIVVSVIGAYNERMPTYEWADDLLLKKALRHIARYAGNIRVPVALLVLNGDLETLDHVVRAIYNDMSVVVVKGTGGAADLIALCLEDFSSLKRELPIMLNKRFTKGLFAKVQEVFKLIIQMEWMISIFDIKVDEHDSLWERITDGITRAWSFEEKHDKGILMTEYLSFNGGDCISKYVANIDGLTSEELFAGCSLNEADGWENKMD